MKQLETLRLSFFLDLPTVIDVTLTLGLWSEPTFNLCNFRNWMSCICRQLTDTIGCLIYYGVCKVEPPFFWRRGGGCRLLGPMSGKALDRIIDTCFTGLRSLVVSSRTGKVGVSDQEYFVVFERYIQHKRMDGLFLDVVESSILPEKVYLFYMSFACFETAGCSQTPFITARRKRYL